MVRLAHYDALHYVVLFQDHEMVYLAQSEEKILLTCDKYLLTSFTWRVHVGFERDRLCRRGWRVPCCAGREPGVVEELGGVGRDARLQVGEVARPAVDLLQQVGRLQGGGSRQRSWDQTKACLLLPRQVFRHRVLQVPHRV